MPQPTRKRLFQLRKWSELWQIRRQRWALLMMQVLVRKERLSSSIRKSWKSTHKTWDITNMIKITKSQSRPFNSHKLLYPHCLSCHKFKHRIRVDSKLGVEEVWLDTLILTLSNRFIFHHPLSINIIKIKLMNRAISIFNNLLKLINQVNSYLLNNMTCHRSPKACNYSNKIRWTKWSSNNSSCNICQTLASNNNNKLHFRLANKWFHLNKSSTWWCQTITFSQLHRQTKLFFIPQLLKIAMEISTKSVKI